MAFQLKKFGAALLASAAFVPAAHAQQSQVDAQI